MARVSGFGRETRYVRKLVLIGGAAVIGFLGASVAVLTSSQVSPEAIERSVDRSAVSLELAWSQPVASTYKSSVVWQSNASLCGPASIANAFRYWEKPPRANMSSLRARVGAGLVLHFRSDAG